MNRGDLCFVHHRHSPPDAKAFESQRLCGFTLHRSVFANLATGSPLLPVTSSCQTPMGPSVHMINQTKGPRMFSHCERGKGSVAKGVHIIPSQDVSRGESTGQTREKTASQGSSKSHTVSGDARDWFAKVHQTNNRTDRNGFAGELTVLRTSRSVSAKLSKPARFCSEETKYLKSSQKST